MPTPSAGIDWDAWRPGSEPAAAQASNLDLLLAQAVGENPRWGDRAVARGSLLASIEDHRLDKLASTVSEAVARGDSVDTLERTLRKVLSDTRWADMVAITEMNRAMTQASMDTYRQNGIEAYEYLSAEDNRVCGQCSESEDDGPYALNQVPSGGLPPAHPLCRCSISPYFATGSDLFLFNPEDIEAAGEEAEASEVGFDEEEGFDEDEASGEDEASDEESAEEDSAGAEPEPEPEPEMVEEPAEPHDTTGSTREIPQSETTETTPTPKPREEPAAAIHDTAGSTRDVGPEPARGEDALRATPSGLGRPDTYERLTQDEIDALRQYKGQLYSNLNEILRRELGHLPDGWAYGGYRDVASAIDSAMDGSRLARPIEVDRALRDGRAVFGAAYDHSLVGAQWTEHSYLSTTADPKVVSWFHAKRAPNPATLHIRVPAHTGAVELSGASYESELLLQRGLRFRVVSDTGPNSSHRVITMEVVR